MSRKFLLFGRTGGEVVSGTPTTTRETRVLPMERVWTFISREIDVQARWPVTACVGGIGAEREGLGKRYRWSGGAVDRWSGARQGGSQNPKSRNPNEKPTTTKFEKFCFAVSDPSDLWNFIWPVSWASASLQSRLLHRGLSAQEPTRTCLVLGDR